MWFRQLEIHHLRNLERVSLALCAGLNLFHGDNGAGKTSVLEAVHLLARGRSFRSPQATELIQRGHDRLTVHAVVEDEHRGRQRVGLARARRGRAELRINGAPERRLSQAASLLPLQVMGPGLSDLIFGPPAGRRQWLDWGVFHVEHGHLAVLRAFIVGLRQRNAALKAAAGRKSDEPSLHVWSDEFARLADAVTRNRRAYLKDLVPVLNRVLARLSPGMIVEARYRPGWTGDEPLRKVLGDSLGREVKSGKSLVGPHRADVEFRVDGSAAGQALSRGQGKVLASAMMLAQAEFLQRSASRSSVFLIDDIGAELDADHGARFFSVLSELGVQVFATANAIPVRWLGLPDVELKTFHVKHGRLDTGLESPAAGHLEAGAIAPKGEECE